MRQNPWPENSDYGKLWRKGYKAGRSDTIAKLIPSFEKMASYIRSQSNKVSKS